MRAVMNFSLYRTGNFLQREIFGRVPSPISLSLSLSLSRLFYVRGYTQWTQIRYLRCARCIRYSRYLLFTLHAGAAGERSVGVSLFQRK